jgi:hypothetical protein
MLTAPIFSRKPTIKKPAELLRTELNVRVVPLRNGHAENVQNYKNFGFSREMLTEISARPPRGEDPGTCQKLRFHVEPLNIAGMRAGAF